MKKNLLFIAVLLGLVTFYGCSGSDSVDPVPEPPTGLTYSPNSIVINEGTAQSSSMPTISGKTPIAFELVSSPNSAISINASTGVISASATLPIGNYTLSVKATNDDGKETFNSAFSITVNKVTAEPSNLAYSPNSISINEGETGTSATPTVGGITPITFSLVSSPSTEISIDPNTGVISSTATLAVGNYSLDVKAKNDDGEETFTDAFSITVNKISPSNLVYTPNSISINEGEVGTSATPTIDGITPTFELVSSPSSEISIDVNTGVISSTTTLAIGNYSLNVKATNSSGNETFSTAFTIAVAKVPEPPTNLAYSPNSIEFTEGAVGTSAMPTISGATPITFELVSSPSSEISIDANTGVISSTATLAVGNYSLNVKATNADGNETFNNIFSMKVNEVKTAPSSLTYSSSSTTSRKHEAKSITATADGTAPLTFEITNSLPSGISINSSNGKIDFAKGISHGDYKITVKVTNTEGSKTFTDVVSFTSEEVVFEGSIGVQSIISNKCSSCHVSGGSRRDYTNFNNAKSFSSTIHSRVNSGSMPQGRAKLPQEEIDRIQQWINDGLKQN
jgi:hypothetical protein